eukprot:CCRYP_020048-RA/>CCRYP_020048-RA protein AED:0.26 eAED:0.17 QI:0/0/0/0.8/1/1/10/0/576
MRLIATTIAGVLAQAIAALGQCFSDPATNTEWAQLINVPSPAIGFGIAIMSSIALYELVGVACFFFIKGKSENFLWRAHFACMASAIDSNAILGTAMLSYKYSFWDGAVLPIGLGLSLILNALFFARKINVDRALTLPDVYAKRYGKVVEIMISICTIISFICLLAGNLVGMGTIISYCLSISKKGAIWLSASLVWSYTVAGGLFSVAATDIFQSAIGWTGCMVLAFYLIKNEESAPPASIGFPGYVYPDESICDMYDGVPCSNNSTQCCYNEELWCPSPDNCRVDNGAYPFGDQRKFSNQMTDPYALTPFPNAIMFNWATIFVLGFGNLAALDFQARCMASRTPKVATVSCLIAGCLTFAVGIPYGYLGPLLGFITDLTVQEPNSRQILAMPFLAFQRADSGFQMLTLLLNFSQTKRPHFLAAGVSLALLLHPCQDGFVILPYPGEEFLNYGPAASTLYPPFFDKPQEELWDPTASGQECDQIQYNDWTGVDSLAAPIAAAVVFISVQWLERNGPIFDFKEDGVMCGYLKTSQQATEVEDDKLGKDASVTVRETVIDYSNRGAHQGDNEVTDVAA